MIADRAAEEAKNEETNDDGSGRRPSDSRVCPVPPSRNTCCTGKEPIEGCDFVDEQQNSAENVYGAGAAVPPYSGVSAARLPVSGMNLSAAGTSIRYGIRRLLPLNRTNLRGDMSLLRGTGVPRRTGFEYSRYHYGGWWETGKHQKGFSTVKPRIGF